MSSQPYPHTFRYAAAILALLSAGGPLGGCPLLPLPLPPTTGEETPSEETTGAFGNTTDKTNGGARYVGSNACKNCHTDVAQVFALHGHAHKLTRIEGVAPDFPAQATRAGVPNPPEGFDWSDISWIIGGYTKKARFIDKDGYILITGLEGVDTQWNLNFPPNGTQAGFAPYEADRDTPKPYDFSCFQCHTTGPQPQDPNRPLFQENRPGMAGTWEEAGVQCEACHGPGSNHFTKVGDEVQINRSAIFVDSTGSETCANCHNRPYGGEDGVIQAKGGFIRHHEQYPELQASPHAGFACTICHDPHRSVTYDRDNALRNVCTACHSTQNMTLFHENRIFVRGDYVEPLGCESCHMPFATKSATAVTVEVMDPTGQPLGSVGRIGDVRTHIFRIDTRPVDYTAMFTDDLSEVVRDEVGRAAITIDFICLRCHNGLGNAPAFTLSAAAQIADGIHEIGQ